jgi:uncharacterized protein
MMTRPIPHVALLIALVCSAGTSFAQDQNAQQPAAPAEQPAVATPAPTLSPSHLALAREIVTASGTSDSLVAVIPEVLNQVHLNLARTRPDLTATLQDVSNAVLVQLVPQREQLIKIAATSLAEQMSEAELTVVADFMKTPAGLNYIGKQKLILKNTLLSMQPFNQELRRTVTTLFREEMKKKGIDL